MHNLRKKLLIISLIFLVKFLSAVYFVHLTECNNPGEVHGLASCSGDATSYLGPIDNLIDNGSYELNGYKAARMPYVGATYFVFRQFTDRDTALSIVVVLQVLLDSIAIYFMALLCSELLKRPSGFYVYLLIALVSMHVSIYNHYMLSESGATGFLCLFLFQYWKYFEENRSVKRLILAGIFLALAVLFKPYFIALYVFAGLEYVVYEFRKSRWSFVGKTVRFSLLLALPLLILDAPWTIRNYMVMGKFVPLQEDQHAGMKFAPAEQAVRSFVENIGESIISWDNKSAAYYFINENSTYVLPERIYSERLTREMIHQARTNYLAYRNNPTDSGSAQVEKQFNGLSAIYKEDHSLFHRFGAPMNITKLFLLHSGSYYLPISRENPCYASWQLVLKLMQSLLYYLVLIFGMMGLFILARVTSFSRTMLAFVLFLIVLFPIVLRTAEARYFHPAYPLLMFGLCYVLLKVWDKVRKKSS